MSSSTDDRRPGKVFSSEHRERSVRDKTARSAAYHLRALRSLAGGVASTVRRGAKPYPLYFDRGVGSKVTDVDGNTYLDYGLAWGPLIAGHAPREVAEAIARQARKALTFGAQHELEFRVAEKLQAFIPCADLVCFASSGTEAVQSALRLARAVTGKPKYLKFEGHYHGWDDTVLVSYHPTVEEIRAAAGAPIPVGLGQRAHDSVVVAAWNDTGSVRKALDTHGHEISAIICEPLLCNSGCIPPEEGFLEFLREVTSASNILLIFDEVITGFRLALGGAQEYYGVTPDLATYAKAVGGGLPVSALVGRKAFMDWIADGRVLHAGTLNGSPISLAGADATLDLLSRDGGAGYPQMSRRGETLRQGVERALIEAGLPAIASGVGPVFHVAFNGQRARNYRDLLTVDTTLYADFCLALLDEGVLVLPDGRWYVSAAHTDEDIEWTLAAVRRTVERRTRSSPWPEAVKA
ncbi:glutamate-1-semialdehyde 2,1-aminomutase [soil metagenome]